MRRELKQILEKLGEERDITKLYFIKAILIENNNKEKRKESKYKKNSFVFAREVEIVSGSGS